MKPQSGPGGRLRSAREAWHIPVRWPPGAASRLLQVRLRGALRAASGTRLGPGSGFTTLELLVVMAILGLLLGLTVAFGRQALAARTLDATSRELEEALRYARQGAVTSQGGSLRVDPAAGGFPGSWKVVLGTQVALEGVLDRDLDLSLVPATPAALVFTSAGTLVEDRTLVLTSAITGGVIRWRLHALTGAAERLP